MDDEVRLLSSSMLVSPHHWWGTLPRSTVCHHSFLVIKILVFPWALVQVCPSWHDIFLGWCRHFRSSSQPCLSPNVSFWWGNLPDGARTGSWIFLPWPHASSGSLQFLPTLYTVNTESALSPWLHTVSFFGCLASSVLPVWQGDNVFKNRDCVTCCCFPSSPTSTCMTREARW